MCEGTKCTHHINDVVKWIESSYDEWEVARWHTKIDREDRYEVWHFDVRNLHEVLGLMDEGGADRFFPGPGPSHHQGIILLKDDANYYRDLNEAEADERARRFMNCWECEAGLKHVCDYCGQDLTCMARGTCSDCFGMTEDQRAQSYMRQRELETERRRQDEALARTDDQVQGDEPTPAVSPLAALVRGVRNPGPPEEVEGPTR